MQKLIVDVYTPPKVEFPPDIRSILVASRYVPASGEYEAIQWGYFQEVDSAMWELSRYYASSFSNTLDSSDRYRSKTDFNLRMLRHNSIAMPEPLPWKGLQPIADKYKASSLAILQGFEIQEGEVKTREITSEQGASFEAVKVLTVNAGWRISQPDRRRMLDENVYSFSKEFRAQAATLNEAIAALPGKTEMYRQACDWAAYSYAQVLIPGSEAVQRDYYKDGHIKLVEAHEAILGNNWQKAESKWEFLAYKGEDDKIKAMASYNMALFCEKDGRLNQALGYANKANNYWPHRRHLKLINELNIKVFDEEDRRVRKEVIRNW